MIIFVVYCSAYVYIYSYYIAILYNGIGDIAEVAETMEMAETMEIVETLERVFICSAYTNHEQ